MENDTGAYQTFKKIFEGNETYNLSIIKVNGNDSKKIEKSRDEDRKYLMDVLINESFQILILDLLLRDRMTLDQEEVVGSDFSGIENVLSLEIARQLKGCSNKEKFLLVFTSSSRICKTHQQFESIRDKHDDKVPKDAVFIFKPNKESDSEILKNCPVDTGINTPACNKAKRERGGCLKKDCFFELLNKYYKDFQEKKNNG